MEMPKFGDYSKNDVAEESEIKRRTEKTNNEENEDKMKLNK